MTSLPMQAERFQYVDEAAFVAMAEAAYRDLPRDFRDAVGNLSIRVVDFADRETLDEFGMESPFELLGLYRGVALPFKSGHDIPRGPDEVYLYRRPILAYARDEGESVESVLRHVLIHEIGHHFGFSDEDMEAIEAEGLDHG